MTLKEDLLEELQKLRLARERPLGIQSKRGPTKKDKHLEEAKRLLEEVKEED